MITVLTYAFLRGLVATLPVIITLYVVYWALSLLESSLSTLLQVVIPASMYWPGMGLVTLIILIFLVGLLLNQFPLDRFYEAWEARWERIPVIKSIYGVTRDFMDYFANDKQKRRFSKVVTVQLKNWDCRVVGFVTEEDLNRHSDQLADEGTVAVYLPMGYQIGGYTILVGRDRIEPVDMSFEEAMRFILTAGVSSNPKQETEAAKGQQAGSA